MTERAMNEAARETSRVQKGAQQWLGTLESLAQQIQKQQQTSQQMVQELMNTYMQLLNTPGSYLSGQAQQQQTLHQTAQQWMEQLQQQQQTFQQQAQQQQQTFQQVVQESLNTYAQLFKIPVSYTQESSRTAQRGMSEGPIGGHDELTVEEPAERLDDLSTGESQRIHDYEEHNRRREVSVRQIPELSERYAALETRVYEVGTYQDFHLGDLFVDSETHTLVWDGALSFEKLEYVVLEELPERIWGGSAPSPENLFISAVLFLRSGQVVKGILGKDLGYQEHAELTENPEQVAALYGTMWRPQFRARNRLTMLSITRSRPRTQYLRGTAALK